MLNILMTSSEFERSIVTERIRDKMSASSRKTFCCRFLLCRNRQGRCSGRKSSTKCICSSGTNQRNSSESDQRKSGTGGAWNRSRKICYRKMVLPQISRSIFETAFREHSGFLVVPAFPYALCLRLRIKQRTAETKYSAACRKIRDGKSVFGE